MSGRIVSTRAYVYVFVVLLALTALTVYVARVDLGALSLPVALGIAVVKVLLVALFFMHLRHGDPLNRLFAVVGAFWVAVLVGFILADLLTREWIDGT